MARWQVYVGLQVTCRILLDHTTSQQVSTELHKAAELFSEDKSGKYTAYRATVSADTSVQSNARLPIQHCFVEGYQASTVQTVRLTRITFKDPVRTAL